MDRGIRRRELLQGGAGMALGMGLAACGVGNESGSKKETQKTVDAKIDGDLVYFNWAEYLDPALIKKFEKRYGVKVRESNFDSMQAMMAKLRSGNAYDLIFPSAEYADRLIKANQLLEIDRAKLKNNDQVYGLFDSPWYDKGSTHTVPYALYATGIAWRADKVDNMTGSWKDLGNESAKGRIYMLDDFQEGIGQANLINGYDLNTIDEAELEKSKQTILDVKPLLRGFSSDTITNMTSGNAWVQHLWNGDVVNIRNTVDDPENIKFEKCKEGLPVGSDTFAIPTNAKHPGTALKFIDFLLEPENAAANIEYFGYPMPHKTADATFAGLVKDDPAINVSLKDLEEGEQFVNLNAEGRKRWDRTWTEVKAG